MFSFIYNSCHMVNKTELKVQLYTKKIQSILIYVLSKEIS